MLPEFASDATVMAAHLEKQEVNSLRASASRPTYLHIGYVDCQSLFTHKHKPKRSTCTHPSKALRADIDHLSMTKQDECLPVLEKLQILLAS